MKVEGGGWKAEGWKAKGGRRKVEGTSVEVEGWKVGKIYKIFYAGL